MRTFLFAFSILLPLLLAFGFHTTGKKNEIWIVLRLFALSIVSTVAVLILERLTVYLSEMVPNFFLAPARAFLGVALPEELIKLAVVLIAAPRNRNGRTLFRFAAYGITAAMGFAAVENLIYLVNKSDVLSVAVVRSLSAIPLHALSGGILGMGAGLAVRRRDQGAAAWGALIVAVAVHGLYNWILSDPKIPPLLIFPLLLTGWGGLLAVLIREAGRWRSEADSAEAGKGAAELEIESDADSEAPSIDFFS